MIFESRPRSDDRDVDRSELEAGLRDTAADVGEQLGAHDAAWRPIVGGEQAAEIAQARGPEQGVRDGVKDDVTVGVSEETWRSRDLDAAETERRPGPERVAVMAEPGAAGPGRREDRGDADEVVRHRHLEVVELAGNHMNGNRTGLEERGL